MSELKDVPTVDLLQELEARRQRSEATEALERKARAATNPPAPLASPDFTILREMIVREVQSEVTQQASSKDFKQYAYEEAMIAVYGDAYFAWRNKQDW